jgi:hypothetical protein
MGLDERVRGSLKVSCYRMSVWLSAHLFSGTLSRQSLLHSASLARLQVVGVTLYFSNDVFRLNLALEAAEGVVY